MSSCRKKIADTMSFGFVSSFIVQFSCYIVQTAVDATFSVIGPDSLMVGTTGVWTITTVIPDLVSMLSLDVLSPISQPGVLAIDAISIGSVGK